jgi:hypothetical protein
VSGWDFDSETELQRSCIRSVLQAIPEYMDRRMRNCDCRTRDLEISVESLWFGSKWLIEFRCGKSSGWKGAVAYDRVGEEEIY